MNPTPLGARIFRLQGRIFPNRLTGVPLLKGTHRGSASATEPHFSTPVAPSPRGISRDARPPADGAAGAVPVRSRPRELRRSPWYPAGHQVPHTHLRWSVRAGRNKGLARAPAGGLASFETTPHAQLAHQIERTWASAIMPGGVQQLRLEIRAANTMSRMCCTISLCGVLWNVRLWTNPSGMLPGPAHPLTTLVAYL